MLQFIQDHRGNTTGVYIPIEDWQVLKSRNADLQKEESENKIELASWQKEIIDQRLEDYYKNPDDVVDFNETMAKIRKSL
jgi:type VI protein secretion system component Hcp